MPIYLIAVRCSCFICTESSAGLLAHTSSDTRQQRMDPPKKLTQAPGNGLPPMGKRRLNCPEFKTRVAMEASSGSKALQEFAADGAEPPHQGQPVEEPAAGGCRPRALLPGLYPLPQVFYPLPTPAGASFGMTASGESVPREPHTK